MRRRPGSDDEEISDETLLSAMAVGDDRAGVSFVRRYQGRAFGVALRILGDPALAEDVAQEALLRVWRHAAVFDARRGSAAAWVATITRNLAVDALRVRRGTPTDPADQLWLGLTSAAVAPDDAAVASSSRARARRALLALPVEQRRAVVLAAMYGWTAAEVAEREAISLGTAKSRVRLALAKLRTTLLPEEAE